MRSITAVGLDLGTRAGFIKAILAPPYDPDGLSVRRVGVFDLKESMRRGGSAARWDGYRNVLEGLGEDIDVMFFEDVPEAVHSGGVAARVHGGLRATLELYALDNCLRLQGVSIQAAKRALTGSGAANKKMMKTAARKRFGVIDDTPTADAADALGVLLAGLQKLVAGAYPWGQGVLLPPVTLRPDR